MKVDWTSRKLSRYRAGLVRVQAAQTSGKASASDAQRAYDGLLAALAGAETLGFRRRLCDTRSDSTERDGYHADPGCGST